jgi:hypothetical protein
MNSQLKNTSQIKIENVKDPSAPHVAPVRSDTIRLFQVK